MYKVVSFLMMGMVVVATFHYADATIDCYVCEGYDSTLPVHQVLNNKYCPQENFDPSKVNKKKATICTATVIEYGGERLTDRSYTYYASKMASNLTTRASNKVTFHGYFCDTALCNDDNPSASSTLTFHLPLLLISLPVALLRCLP